MTVPAPPTIPAAPTPAPTRADPANFRARADAYHVWLPPFVNDTLPDVLEWMGDRNEAVEALSISVEASADAAQLAATQASGFATEANDAIDLAVAGAAAVAGSTKWISGTTYAEGAAVWSPITLLTYRRKTAGAGTTDPSIDTANWQNVSDNLAEKIVVISANTTAIAYRTYVLTASLTLTLPASPKAGEWVAFSNRSGTSTPVIGRNGQNIMGKAEDMTLDNINYFGTLVFADATRGWIFK